MCPEKIIIFLTSLGLLCCKVVSKINSNDQTHPCDNFHGQLPGTVLHKCPQAKFMSSEDFECYDKSYKDRLVFDISSLLTFRNYHTFFVRYESSSRYLYWCMSRKIYNETLLRSVKISTAFRKETIDSFSTHFQYNGTHVKCNSTEDWLQSWYDTSNHVLIDPKIPCVTSSTNVPIATFMWTPRQML